ncbi:flavodoxin family protein [Desulfofundulus thermobenzoicus]
MEDCRDLDVNYLHREGLLQPGRWVTLSWCRERERTASTGIKTYTGAVEHGRCRQGDDMVQIYRALLEADGIVLGSPIYMGYVTAQTKLFMDRLFAFLRPGLNSIFPPGKKFVMVYSQGGGDDREMIHGLVQRLGRILGMQVKGIAGGNGMNDLNTVKSNNALLEEAFRLGKELVG